MGELTEMIRNILDMECSHIKAGYITKEFAEYAIGSFIKGLMTESKTEAEFNYNRLLRHLAKWADIYISNVNIEEGAENGCNKSVE